MAEETVNIGTKVGVLRIPRIACFGVLLVFVLAAGCRRKREPLEEEGIPEWLKHPASYTERTIPPEWFKSELKRMFAGTKRVRILRGYGMTRTVAAVENSTEKIAALVSSLEVDGPTMDAPGVHCRCVPDLYLEFEGPSGKEILSPVCGRRLRLGTLEAGIKWPDPRLTPGALNAFKNWIEDHGVAFECCGERSHPVDGGHSLAGADAAGQPVHRQTPEGKHR